MPKFAVQISKYYFPEFLWPKDPFNAAFHRQIIEAESRIEAAQKYWELNKDNILEALGELAHQTGWRKKIISLHVSGADAINGKSRSRNFAGRMVPIKAWDSQDGDLI